MRWGRLLRVFGILVALAVVVVAGLGLWLLRSGLPRRSGEAAIPGLGAEASVAFDGFGTPYVRAASALDAAAALGWLHANDRLFQMELTRRAATGRLSELFGQRALRFDRRIRRLGIPRAIDRLLASASPETRALLDAYARGVNAWIESRGSDLPPELRLLRRRPEPWRPADSVGVIFVMARTLSPILDPPELERFRWLRAFGTERARELAGDREAVVFPEIAELAAKLEGEAEPLGARAEGAGLGSNNWAVGPARSASGHALVANDPHLGLGLPNVWYPASLDAPDYRAVGTTLPGAPGVVLGRGPRVAWAVTNLYVDDVDLFFEELDAAGTHVRRGDRWLPIERRVDRIRLDDGREVEVEVLATDRGPLLAADPAEGLPPRSVAWTGWEPGDQLAAFVALARAASVDEVPAAVAGYAFPAQNLVAADADGGLLWTPLGRSPRREGLDGVFPAPGWIPEVGWRGLVPAGENPVLRDPEDGFLATANSFLPVEQPEWFEGDFDTPYRMERIREVLASRDDWSVEAFARLQTDVVSTWARELVAGIGTAYEGDAGRAARALAAWDGAMAERGPSALFALVERELQRAVFEDEARIAGLPRFGTRWRLARLLAGEGSEEWFDDVSTAAVETRAETVAAALDAAWRRGVELWGGDVAGWDYAGIHTLTLDHPLGSLPFAARWLERGPFPLPGTATTVLALHGPWVGDRIDITYGPSMRLVTDAADPSSTRSILPGGQSGHPFDAHYDDQLPLWLAGELRPLPWSRDAIDAAAVSTLTLRPAR